MTDDDESKPQVVVIWGPQSVGKMDLMSSVCANPFLRQTFSSPFGRGPAVGYERLYTELVWFGSDFRDRLAKGDVHFIGELLDTVSATSLTVAHMRLPSTQWKPKRIVLVHPAHPRDWVPSDPDFWESKLKPHVDIIGHRTSTAVEWRFVESWSYDW